MATLLRRTFAIDMLHCERWGGHGRRWALITQEKTEHKLLAPLGLPPEAPTRSPARVPPEPLALEGLGDSVGIDPSPPTEYA